MPSKAEIEINTKPVLGTHYNYIMFKSTYIIARILAVFSAFLLFIG